MKEHQSGTLEALLGAASIPLYLALTMLSTLWGGLSPALLSSTPAPLVTPIVRLVAHLLHSTAILAMRGRNLPLSALCDIGGSKLNPS